MYSGKLMHGWTGNVEIPITSYFMTRIFYIAHYVLSLKF